MRRFIINRQTLLWFTLGQALGLSNCGAQRDNADKTVPDKIEIRGHLTTNSDSIALVNQGEIAFSSMAVEFTGCGNVVKEYQTPTFSERFPSIACSSSAYNILWVKIAGSNLATVMQGSTIELDDASYQLNENVLTKRVSLEQTLDETAQYNYKRINTEPGSREFALVADQMTVTDVAGPHISWSASAGATSYSVRVSTRST